MDFAEIMRTRSQQASPPVPVVSRAQQRTYDEARAADIAQTRQLVERLIDGWAIDEFTRSMLTVNTSTMVAREFERPEPTKTDKIQALWDYWKFIEIIDFHGGPLAFSDCHFETTAWSFREDASFRQLIMEARGHLKSTLFSVGRILWRIYQNPNIRCFVGTESLKLSRAFVKEVEGQLTDEWNQHYVWNSRPHFDGPLIPTMDSLGKQRRQLVRDVSDEFGQNISTGGDKTKKKLWRAEAIQVVRSRVLKEPTLTAGSVGQVSTGFHFDDVTFDDVVSFDNTRNPSAIDKVFSWIYDVESLLDPAYLDVELLLAFNRCAPNHIERLRKWSVSGGRQYVIGTRYAEEDYYGHLIDNASSLHYDVHVKNIFANGIDDTDGYRWPEKWNKELELATMAKFQRKYGSTGMSRYYSQYHNKIVSFAETVLNWDKIQWIQPTNFKLCEDGWVEVYDQTHKVVAEFKPRLVMDPSATASTTSDFCAIAVGGNHKETLYVCDFWMGKKPVSVYLDKMYELVDKWGLYEVVIEMVSGFKVLKTTLQQMPLIDKDKYRLLSIKSYEPPTNTLNKQQRIETVLSPLIDNYMLYLPFYVSANAELRKQFQFFGTETVKDDGPDVLAILKEKAYSSRMVRNNVVSLDDYRNQGRHINDDYGGIDYESEMYGGVSYG